MEYLAVSSPQAVRDDVDRILKFFDTIGLEYTQEKGVIGSFAENLEIKKGVIHFDYDLVAVLDLLHDGGHMALIPKCYRHYFCGNLMAGFKRYFEMITLAPPLDPVTEILMCCEDTQVTAWAWAAGIKLGIKHEDIITGASYGGTGEAIRQTLQFSEISSMPYVGVAMLHHSGYTKKFNSWVKKKEPETVFYPEMNYWTADQALSANGYSVFA